jgi:hypothetical protein
MWFGRVSGACCNTFTAVEFKMDLFLPFLPMLSPPGVTAPPPHHHHHHHHHHHNPQVIIAVVVVVAILLLLIIYIIINYYYYFTIPHLGNLHQKTRKYAELNFELSEQ